MIFRRKTQFIKAIQFNGFNNPFDELKKHKCDYRGCDLCAGDNQLHSYITNKRNNKSIIVNPGDWVVYGSEEEGVFKIPDIIFKNNYEPME